MGLLRILFWVALFAAFTLCFVVLFENGTKNYFVDFPKNAEKELASLKAFTAPAKAKADDGSTK